MIICIFILGCAEVELFDRESKIPTDAVKMTPASDAAPVKSYSDEYNDPVPLPYPVNTAGAEDSAFILPDGNTLYFFFTPDVRVPVQQQVVDGVTGIYMARKMNGEWQKPERVYLQKPGKAGLDGCEFVLDEVMYFCTVREGYTGIHWFKADFREGKWSNWKIADDELKAEEYNTGELHIYGDELYFHSDDKPGGKGGRDIWMSKKVDGIWQVPVNVEAVNTERDDGYPALSPDGSELWISRDYGTWRSKRQNGEWSEPELMFSPFFRLQRESPQQTSFLRFTHLKAVASEQISSVHLFSSLQSEGHCLLAAGEGFASACAV